MTDLRPARSHEAAVLYRIAEATGMFQPEELDALRGMIEGDLAAPDGPRLWILALEGDDPAGATCVTPEPFQPDVFNLLFLGVVPAHRRAGIARDLVTRAGQEAQAAGARLLIVETSSDPAFAPARTLYRGMAFALDGTIRDYYGTGQDKMIFRRHLV